MGFPRTLGAPFGERTRTGRRDERLVSRGLVVDGFDERLDDELHALIEDPRPEDGA